MIRTILWYTYFWLYMIFSIILSVPLIVLFLLPGSKKIRDRYIHFTAGTWAKSLLNVAGAAITVAGRDNLPHTGRICFVANHQGAFDIPIILSTLPGPIGFIAKKELALLPIVNIWMRGLGCIFINRSNRRAALESIEKGIQRLKSGRFMIIFPEGTRSRGPHMNTFKPGSLKLPIRSQAFIVPITISGSYRLKELYGRIQPAEVTVTIHKPIDGSTYKEDQTAQLCRHLTEVIGGPLTTDGSGPDKK